MLVSRYWPSGGGRRPVGCTMYTVVLAAAKKDGGTRALQDLRGGGAGAGAGGVYGKRGRWRIWIWYCRLGE